MRKKAFTLIELLVVIAIIALLLSIILPSMRKAKQIASMINCLANQKNLATAFIMYANDNDGKFCSGYVHGDTANRNPPSWVKPPLAYTPSGGQTYMGSSPASLKLEHRLNGIREGALYPYLNSTDMFHCPGDRRLVDGSAAVLNSSAPLSAAQVYRSYGMPDFYNARHDTDEKLLTNVRGSAMLFVEDQYDWYYNVDGWSYVPYTQWLWDPLGNYHNKSCTFAFVDGHADNHKWRDERTMIFMSDRQLAASRGFGKGQVFNPRNPDLDWLDEHYPSKKQFKSN